MVHELCYGAGLEWNRTYSRQNKEKLVRIYEVVCISISSEFMAMLIVERLVNVIHFFVGLRIIGPLTPCATNISRIIIDRC